MFRCLYAEEAQDDVLEYSRLSRLRAVCSAGTVDRLLAVVAEYKHAGVSVASETLSADDWILIDVR